MSVSQPVVNPDSPAEIRGEGLFGSVAERVEAFPRGNQQLPEFIQFNLTFGNEGKVLENLLQSLWIT